MTESLNDVATSTVNLLKKSILTLPYFDSTNYLNNVKSLQIKPGDIKTTKAFYVVYSNTILLPSKTDTKLLLHELIHMASSNRTQLSKMSYTMGYEIVTENNKRITALNEGLTQYLVCKATDGNDKDNVTYPIETRIASMLIYIFGEEVIYKYFFKADPVSFVKSIIATTGDNSIGTLILKMDELLLTMKDKETTYFNSKCVSLLNDIQKSLIDMFNKMKDKNNLDNETFKEMMITNSIDNIHLKNIVDGNDLEIEQYFIDTTKQK